MKKQITKNSHWLAWLIVCVIVAIYWGVVASDRYVSQAAVVLESPQIASVESLSFQSLFSGGGGGSDMLILREFMLSADMLKTIDKNLDFRKHYSNGNIDYISRLPGEDVPVEDLHEYYLKRISVEFDDYSQVLKINVRAFTPEMAQAITQLLLEAGEAKMNEMGRRLAEEQVAFLSVQVEGLSTNLNDARQVLLKYQNDNGLVSPTGTVESLSSIVAGLESQLSNVKAKRAVMLSFQSANSSEVVRVNSEIKAINQQIEKEKSRMAQQNGGALNALSSEYQTLELKFQFALTTYSTALAALESTRIEAARKLKQVTIIQSPTLPEYAIEPERIYNITVFTVIASFAVLIFQMLVLIIKDHRD